MIYISILLKDIIQRNKIRNVNTLDKIIRHMIDNIGHTFSARNISKYFKHEHITISENTINNYLKFCSEAYLINKVEREDLKGKKILQTQEKYYISDHGFNQVLVGKNQNKISQILENIVYLELLRYGFEIYIGKFNDLEIDFICKKRDYKIYVQVSYILVDEKTREREFKPLLKIKDNYPKYVISLDEYTQSYEGIKHINLIDFLKIEDFNKFLFNKI